MKREPAWLTREAVLAMHGQLIAEHGGDAGIRDRGLLESALASPKHHYVYGEGDIFVLAAAYAYSITRNHPFLDGNKRTAFLAGYVFLGINGLDLEASEQEAVALVTGLSDRSVSAEAFADWLRRSCKPKRRKRPTKGRPTRRPRA